MMQRLPMIVVAWYWVVACSSSSPLTLDSPTAISTDPVTGGAERRVALVAPFSDGREIKDRCGMRKSVFMSEVGNVLCREDPTRWLPKQFSDELRAAGFRVVDERELGMDGVRIQGTLLKLFVEPVPSHVNTIETDIQVKLLVSSESGLSAERTFYVKHRVLPADPRMATFYKTSLDRTTRVIGTKMVSAIIELMNRFPTLGRGMPANASSRGDGA